MAGLVQLPAAFAEAAAEFADGSKTPAEPRDAATVVLLRPGAEGPEVYLLRRQVSMEFAGGMCVFPGGGVDPRDFDTEIAWAGPSPAAWAERLGTDEAQARALVCAAVRETFEESGVLLAGESPDAVVADTTGADWEADRIALEKRELAMTEFLSRRGLVLRTDLLGAWAGWLTPIFEPRRYRTWFFVAELPAGQVTRDVSTESDQVVWLPAIRAVEQAEEREILMLPPTYITSLDVARYDDPAAVLAAAAERRVEMFCPAVETEGEGFTLTRPPEADALLTQRAKTARWGQG
ncbi:NUDIX hydrolase [Nocardioides marmoriginsengisoli]|uniref:NUDIX hydrolase n=1 Tax=Nocardioides marmoriginsengisoli TaxID=661483 RepID=A0A3N0CGN2_9ACTN|nr:NUDIX hydrolase [Nocardioides marmoriginsengisoli]RNL62173.1 NUDIX hydrolase [Nocardioides marmoriginsengisoli]